MLCPQTQRAKQVPCSHTAYPRTQPCRDCSRCMGLQPYRKDGAVVSGERPEMELHTSLSPPDRDTVPWEHTLPFADTAPFLIYGKPPQHPPWMSSFPWAGIWDPGPAQGPPLQQQVWGQGWLQTHHLLSPASLWELMLWDSCCIVV